jgi:Cd2+/Zn2+-exporting ATPase
VASAIKIGRYTAKIVRQNIIGAISIKIIILIAGALGLASLWLAVFADVGVALLAVANSLLVLYKKYQ